MKAIALVRVSTDEQGESGLGLEAQRAALKSFAEREAIELLETVEAVHGSASDEHYELLGQLLTRCRKEKAVLCVAKIDRYGRSTKAMALLEESGVRLVVAELGLAAGQIVIDMLAAVAKEERRLVSVRTKAALAALKARGQKLGTAAKAPEEIARMARRAAEVQGHEEFSAERQAVITAALEGRSYREAAVWLNDRGVKAAAGGAWQATQVMRAAKRMGVRA
jgi:DNA invertase Pin-like site-specific DNA recombinase